MDSGLRSDRKTPARRVGAGLIAAAVLLLLLVLIIVAIAGPRCRESELGISGFWVGEPAFLDAAGLGSMYMYVAPADSTGLAGRVRQGYLIMTGADGEFISNQGIEIRYSGGPARWAGGLKSHFSAPAAPYTVANAAFTYDDSAVMPETMSIAYVAPEGTLSLYGPDKIFAFLTKDAETSLSANEAFAAGESFAAGETFD